MRLTKIHPRTGEELVPLFVTKRGKTVWPQLGASPEDPSNKEGDDGEGGSGGDDDGTDGSTGGSDGASEGEKGSGDAVTREDLEAVIRRMKAADQRAGKAEAELKKIEDAKKDELTKATERVEALEKENAALLARIKEADLRDAFGQVEGISFKKPAVALRIARADGYLDDAIEEDGTVNTKLVAKKVKEFAEAYPELVTGKDAGTTGTGTVPTGQPAGSGRKKPAGPDDSDIKKRYGHLIR